MPSSRGCEGCRKRKKKCDLAQPSCSRCTRYGIRCVGCGERVFKFKNATIGYNGIQAEPAPSKKSVPKPKVALERPLGNDLSKTVNSFISHLEIANPSYSIHGFGPFLSDVPQRLEQSEILRASARAFTTSVQAIYSDNSTAVQAIKDYGAAITCLRSAFAKSPKEVKSADTLCGVYLLLLAQHFMGASTLDSATPYRGILYILQSQSIRKDQDAFTARMVDLASLLMVTETITHPEFDLNPWSMDFKQATLFRQLRQYCSVDIKSTNLSLNNLIKVAQYLKEPEHHLSHLRASYDLMRQEADELIPITVQLHQARHDAGRSGSYVICESACAVLHAITTTIRRTMQMFHVDDKELAEHNIEAAERMLEAANRAWEYRPLGTTYMPKTLCLTFATTDDKVLRERLEDMIEDYRDAFLPSPTRLIMAFEKRFEDLRLRAQSLVSRHLNTDTTSPSSTGLGGDVATFVDEVSWTSREGP